MFLIIGGIAIAVSIGYRRRAVDATGALAEIFAQPLGSVLIGIVAVGLLSFAAWRVLQSIFDADDYGRDRHGLARRAGFGGSAVLYLGLAVWAASFLVLGASGSSRARADWTIWLLAQPLGEWILAGIGISIMIAGVTSGIRAFQAEFKHRLKAHGAWRRWTVVAGRIGLVARGFVFLLIGGFVVFAAWTSDANEVKGFAAALGVLGKQPYGWILVGATGIGLFIFGLFEILQAMFHRVDVET